MVFTKCTRSEEVQRIVTVDRDPSSQRTVRSNWHPSVLKQKMPVVRVWEENKKSLITREAQNTSLCTSVNKCLYPFVKVGTNTRTKATKETVTPGPEKVQGFLPACVLPRFPSRTVKL